MLSGHALRSALQLVLHVSGEAERAGPVLCLRRYWVKVSLAHLISSMQPSGSRRSVLSMAEVCSPLLASAVGLYAFILNMNFDPASGQAFTTKQWFNGITDSSLDLNLESLMANFRPAGLFIGRGVYSGSHAGGLLNQQAIPTCRDILTKRASSSRSKTGCSTCKLSLHPSSIIYERSLGTDIGGVPSLGVGRQRHVKCDEARPHCRRCMTWQGFCPGYAASPPSSIDEPSVVQLANLAGSQSRLFRQPDDHLFADEFEKLYFDSWLTLSAGLAGQFVSPTWTRTIPQIGWRNSAVRYAAMAVGALQISLASSAAGKPIIGNIGQSVLEDRHYQAALRCYNLAIRGVSLSTDIRDTIVCCLLFTCLESLQGRSSSSLGHIYHASSLLGTLIREENCQALESVEPAASLRLDKDITWMCQALDEQAWTYLYLNPFQYDLDTWRRPFLPLGHMMQSLPKAFETTEVARRWWSPTHHKSAEFVRNRLLGCIQDAEQSRLTPRPYLEEQRPYLDCLEQWYAAFQPLYTESMKLGVSDPLYLQACSLSISYLTAYMLVRCPVLCMAADMEPTTTICRELVRLCGVLLENCGDIFTMSNGTTGPLMMTLVRCREPNVRRQATSLLRKYPRRDGLWDTLASATPGVPCVEVDNAGRSRSTSGVIRVKCYKLDAVSCEWKYCETTLKVMCNEALAVDGWHRPWVRQRLRQKDGTNRTFTGIKLASMAPTTGRWLLFGNYE